MFQLPLILKKEEILILLLISLQVIRIKPT